MTTIAPNYYLVVFRPRGSETVNTLRIVDAWASTGSITDARQTMQEHHDGGQYVPLGPGHVYVVRHVPQHDLSIN